MILEKTFNLGTFIYSETAKRLNIDNNPTDEHFVNLTHLHKLLVELQERLCVKFAKPIQIKISSGYRSEALNKKIGGVATSEHCEGRAVDTTVIGITLEEYYQSMRILAKNNAMAFGQVIIEFGVHNDKTTDDWVHISLPSGKHKNEFMRSTIVKGKRGYWRE